MDRMCELYERKCINCGECEVCDLDNSKKCTNCGKCIDEVDDYRSVNIEDFVETHIYKDEINKKEKKNKK